MSEQTALARPRADRTNLYAEITDKIIAEPEAGRASWMQHWTEATTSNRLSNLRNLCQKCHMLRDRPHDLARRWITYRKPLAISSLGHMPRNHRRYPIRTSHSRPEHGRRHFPPQRPGTNPDGYVLFARPPT
jgi:hypothetical protein